MGTVGRTDELRRFLASLDGQSCRDFELIVVDQNSDDRLVPMLAQYGTRFPVTHLRAERGLSRARNVGLRLVSGKIVAFPDDDCRYPAELLSTIDRFFFENPRWDGLTGRCTDEAGNLSMGRFHADSGAIGFLNVWNRCTSFTIFLRREVVERVGPFDETLGVGAGTRWGSAEEMDYVIRAVREGFRLYYNAELVVFHPLTVPVYDGSAANRHRHYGMGMGRVFRKHGYPVRWIMWQLIRPLGGSVLALCRLHPARAKYHFAGFYGRLVGWLAPL